MPSAQSVHNSKEGRLQTGIFHLQPPVKIKRR